MSRIDTTLLQLFHLGSQVATFQIQEGTLSRIEDVIYYHSHLNFGILKNLNFKPSRLCVQSSYKVGTRSISRKPQIGVKSKCSHFWQPKECVTFAKTLAIHLCEKFANVCIKFSNINLIEGS